VTGVLLTAVLTACEWNTVYNHYEHTPIAGWEKNDTLNFVVGPLKDGGDYVEEVGVRISGDYPFTGLNLIVEQLLLPSHEKRSDTLCCSLIDEQGNAKGRGISHYQYLFHLTTLKVEPDGQLHIAIRHDMKREILPGIADIGIKLSR
jgi:gliding motility-associated lipoprotein GldH